MKRLSAILVPLALLLAACSGGSGADEGAVVASVGPDELLRSELVDLLDAVAANDDYLEFIRGQMAASGGTYEVEGDGGPGTYAAEFSAEQLSQWIFYTVLDQQVAAEGLEVTDADRDAAEVLVSFVYGGQEPPERAALWDSEPDPGGVVMLEGFGAAYLDAFLDGVAALLVLERERTGEPTDEELQALYEELLPQLERACAAHILLAPDPEATDQEAAMADALVEAQAVQTRLAAGEDFATVAQEVSDDPGSGANGGDLGCGPRGQYVPEFEDAVWNQDLDIVSEPIQTQFGYHLITVSERGTPTFEEAEADVRAQAQSQSAGDFQAELTDWMANADVTVDPAYGTWDPLQGVVQVPETAPLPTTTVVAGSG